MPAGSGWYKTITRPEIVIVKVDLPNCCSKCGGTRFPMDDEKEYFHRAFRLIDEKTGTNWADVYATLEKQAAQEVADAGGKGKERINWGHIPGLLVEEQYGGGKGYKAAVSRVALILSALIKNWDTENEVEIDYVYLKELKDLVGLALGIYEARVKALKEDKDKTYEDQGNGGHIVACCIWRECSQKLEDALEILEFKQKHPWGLQRRSRCRCSSSLGILLVALLTALMILAVILIGRAILVF